MSAMLLGFWERSLTLEPLMTPMTQQLSLKYLEPAQFVGHTHLSCVHAPCAQPVGQTHPGCLVTE